jgi:hypothetical protein
LKIDLSTIFLVIIAVIPGLFAQRSRNLIAPRSLETQGASAELAELVALGIATHGILAYIVAVLLLLFGCLLRCNPGYFFGKIDSSETSLWCMQHTAETALLITTYIFVAFLISHLLGFAYGAWRLKSPVTTRLFGHAEWPKRFGIRGLLGERPIIYEVLNPEIDNDVAKLVFVELEMKNGLGFYSGQLSQFAIVKDEDPHKPIFIINVWFKKERDDEYKLIDSDGLMLDLADVATLFVKQVSDNSVSSSDGIDSSLQEN